MLLTWKIFVAIMSMVSLTLQMDSSDTGSSSNLSPRWAYDEQRNCYYPSPYNLENPFKAKFMAHVCFALVTLYCRTENEKVTSDDCAKQGILLFRITEEDPLNTNTWDPISWVDRFFYRFRLKPGNFKLPQEFCVKDAPEIPLEKGDNLESMLEYDENAELIENSRQEDDENDKPVILDPICLAELQPYSDKIPIPYSVEDANFAARREIANFAFLYRSTLGLHERSFEKKYLEHISENVSSLDSSYNPYTVCEKYKKKAKGLFITEFLANHLGLQFYK